MNTNQLPHRNCTQNPLPTLKIRQKRDTERGGRGGRGERRGEEERKEKRKGGGEGGSETMREAGGRGEEKSEITKKEREIGMWLYCQRDQAFCAGACVIFSFCPPLFPSPDKFHSKIPALGRYKLKAGACIELCPEMSCAAQLWSYIWEVPRKQVCCALLSKPPFSQ